MYYFRVRDGFVTDVVATDEALKSPWIAAEDRQFPGGKVCWDNMVNLRWVDGAFVEMTPDYTSQSEPPATSTVTREDVELKRSSAYRSSVDPITCEINRLRDMLGTPEEIAEAEARREVAVKQIKEQYPYPEVTNG